MIIAEKQLNVNQYIVFTTDISLCKKNGLRKDAIFLPPNTYLDEHDWKSTHVSITKVLESLHSKSNHAYVPHLWNSAHLLLAGHFLVQSFSYIEEGLGSSKCLVNMIEHREETYLIYDKCRSIRTDLHSYVFSFLSTNGVNIELNPDSTYLRSAYFILETSFKNICTKKRHRVLADSAPLVPKDSIGAVLLPSPSSLKIDQSQVLSTMLLISIEIKNNFDKRSHILLKPHRSTPSEWLKIIFRNLLAYGFTVEVWCFYMLRFDDIAKISIDPCMVQLEQCLIFDSLSALQYMLNSTNCRQLMFSKSPSMIPVRML